MDPYDSKRPTNPVTKAAPNRDNYIEPWDSRSKPRDVKTNHRDDYKDPWDSQMPASLPKSSYEEDEDYTVPYDAGMCDAKLAQHYSSCCCQSCKKY